MAYNDEETRYMSDEAIERMLEDEATRPVEQPIATAKPAKQYRMNPAAFAVGGVVAGAAVGAAATSMASAPSAPKVDMSEIEPNVDDDAESDYIQDNGIETGGRSTDMTGRYTEINDNGTDDVLEINVDENAPVEEIPVDYMEVDTGGNSIQFASVSDDMSFSQAFAAARSQVGAGGAFEWRGNVYGTYYQNEWNHMSAQEQQQFSMAAVHENSGMASDPSQTYYAHTDSGDVKPGELPTSYERVDDDPVENEIRVLGVETMENENGEQMNVAAFEIQGEHVIMVDLDDDSVMDVAIGDFNHDGEINMSSEDMMDISGQNITLDEIEAMQRAQDGAELASLDMPDYTNDADISDYGLV